MIGNNQYRNILILRNAVNDAQTMRDELSKLGFDVIYRSNANRRQMNRAINKFIGRLSRDTVGVVYYSGHGMQIHGANYLLPVDILRANYADDVVDDSIAVNRLLGRMSTVRTKFSLMILDACRNNPFGRSIGGKGLAAPSSNASGIMVVYAAGANQEALDRLTRHDTNPNSLFTREFIKSLRKPGLTVPELIYDARQAVISQAEAVGHTQTPAIYDESRGTFVFNPGARQPLPPLPLPPPPARCTYCPEMVSIPAGSFMMGSPKSKKGRYDREGPVHRVQVQAFQMGKYEVTVGQFKHFVQATSYRGSNISYEYGCKGFMQPNFAQDDKHPVACITWHDAVAYAKWLSQQTSKQYRLPTEAEWEYAARAGTTTPFHTGNCLSTDQANYDGRYPYANCPEGKYRQKTVKVGSFAANSWGLHDTAGNVWEWTCSAWGDPYNGSEKTCNNSATGRKVLRGGSWINVAHNLRSAYRGRVNPNDRGYNGGFRVVF